MQSLAIVNDRGCVACNYDASERHAQRVVARAHRLPTGEYMNLQLPACPDQFSKPILISAALLRRLLKPNATVALITPLLVLVMASAAFGRTPRVEPIDPPTEVVHGDQFPQLRARTSGIDPGDELAVMVDIEGRETLLDTSKVAPDSTVQFDLGAVRLSPGNWPLSIRKGQFELLRLALSVVLPAPDRVQILQAPPAQAYSGRPFSAAPKVRVTRNNRPLVGVPVTAIVTPAEHVLTRGEVETTNSSGEATFEDLVLSSKEARATTLAFQSGPVVSTPSTVGLKAAGRLTLSLVKPPPKSVRAGKDASVPFSVLAVDEENHAVPDLAVYARFEGCDVVKENTSRGGLASFQHLPATLGKGDHRLIVWAETGEFLLNLDPVQVDVGNPAIVRVLTYPAPQVWSDTTLTPHPSVQVVDGGGNALGGVRVKANVNFNHGYYDNNKEDRRAWFAKLLRLRQLRKPNGSPALRGGTIIETDSKGIARFDDLSIFAEEGHYVLHFDLVDNAELQSEQLVIANLPQRYLNRSYLSISAIKSIAGVRPDNEFFDIRFRFRMGEALSLLACSDIALANRESDTLRSSQSRLTEATFQPSMQMFTDLDPQTSIPQRQVFWGGTVKVFNTVPYYGVHIGGIELGGSPFVGSSFSIAHVWPFEYSDIVIDGNRVKPMNSLVADFFVRSEMIDFFRVLTIRGSVLLPINDANALESRIAVAIPVGGVFKF
jgi:hypothetical protein